MVAVSDGDTVTVLDADRLQYKVRLAGIDAPEKAQPFGQASKISLSDQTFGREVLGNWEKRIATVGLSARFQSIIGTSASSRSGAAWCGTTSNMRGIRRRLTAGLC